MINTGEGFSHSYPAVADSVPSVRRGLTEFAAGCGASEERTESIRLAASEAVTNAVLHAYDRSRGTIQVSASYVGGEFWVFVADDGTGLRPRGPHSGLGLGLALIAQLADEFQILSRSTGGTELRMQFKLTHPPAAPRRSGDEHGQLRGSVSSAAVAA
jgi:stage II sporulation protein AB (anti-sigma F factor)